MSKVYALGDIHGQYEKLVNVLKAANVDFENDVVIQLGDIVDRGPEPFKCIDMLRTIKNIIFIRGNHDEEFRNFLHTDAIPFGGQHGSWDTLNVWRKFTDEQKQGYQEFFENEQIDYYIDDKKRIFVHGGFNRHEPIANQSKIQFYWDRDLLAAAMSFNTMCYEDGNRFKFKIKDGFKEVWIGHTPTLCWNITTPMILCNRKVINLDTGSGKGGMLTLMDVETKQYWQN